MDLKDMLWEETEDGIVTVTFNRPDELNPITVDGLAAGASVKDRPCS